MVRTLLIILAVVALLLVGAVGAYFLLRAHPAQSTSQWPSGAPFTNDKTKQQAAADLFHTGMDAYHADQLDRARSIFEDITQRYPDTWAAKKAWLQLGDIYVPDDKRLEAFQKGLEAADETTRPSVSQAITLLKTKLERAQQPPPSESPYTVRAGDTLSSIARQFGTKVEIIKLANNQFSDNIVTGHTLKISTTMPEIQVDRQKYRLLLIWKGQTVLDRAIGIGKDDSTPVGEFVIDTKLVNPDWYNKNRRIPFGSPENILGTRWLGIKDTPGHTGYGIHGTTQPDSIPGPTSAGCIRMLNRDVEELFEWAPIGTKVTIK